MSKDEEIVSRYLWKSEEKFRGCLDYFVGEDFLDPFAVFFFFAYYYLVFYYCYFNLNFYSYSFFLFYSYYFNFLCFSYYAFYYYYFRSVAIGEAPCLFFIQELFPAVTGAVVPGGLKKPGGFWAPPGFHPPAAGGFDPGGLNPVVGGWETTGGGVVWFTGGCVYTGGCMAELFRVFAGLAWFGGFHPPVPAGFGGTNLFWTGFCAANCL